MEAINLDLKSGIQREFLMTDSDYKRISSLAYRYTGIVFSETKKNLIYGRLARRLRALGLKAFSEYHSLLDDSHQPEVSHFINAITTNQTSFFREPLHFEFLKDRVFPELLPSVRTTGKLRAWSAGCSTGEEAFSLAILMKEFFGESCADMKLLGTDLDSNVLEKADSGMYEISALQTVPEEIKSRWFEQDPVCPELMLVDQDLKDMVQFKRLNLLETWPMKGTFDFIFCRNVFIYFDNPTQQRILKAFAQKLSPNGYLFVGHSETLKGADQWFEPAGQMIYRKKFSNRLI